MYAGRLQEAESEFKKVLELNPQSRARKDLALVYLARSNPQAAVAVMQTEPDPNWRLYGLALAFHAAGKKKESEAVLAEYIEKYHDIAAFQIAEIYAYRGEREKAFEWLEWAYKQRDVGLTFIKKDPLLAGLERDPRYTVFLKKMRLPLD